MTARTRWRRRVSDWLGPRWTVRARCAIGGKPFPRWGNLRRTRPFSVEFGADRGTPIDRYYLDHFFSRHRTRITGRVLEIQMVAYARRFGDRVSVCDTIDISPEFHPTYVCDLARADDVVPSDSYDCFLMPSTLQHLRDVEPALVNALRIVRPGGLVLATAAGFIPLIADGGDYWRLSAAGWQEVARRVWPGCAVEVAGYGNCLAAIAALHGIAVEELDHAELDVFDPRYPVVTGLACIKPASGG